MNASEFIKEVKDSDICPDNFDNIYKEFMEYQKLATDMLVEFHRICEKHNVMYQLAYGSLLGAVRDNGQIPWDYDVDVFVPYEEKGKLIKALGTDLPDKYYFYCPEVDPKCRHFFIRIAPQEYKSEVLHIDVFIMTGSPNSMIEREKYISEIKKISKNRFYKLVNIRDESKGYPKHAIKLLLYKILAYRTNITKAAERYNQLCSKYSIKNSSVYIRADIYADRRIFPAGMWETQLITTDIGSFRIPKQYNEILKSRYGEYLSLPPLESRLREMLRHYKRIKYNGRKTNEN